MDEDEQGQLKHEASRRYSVQVLRKAGRELTESSFYTFAKMLK